MLIDEAHPTSRAHNVSLLHWSWVCVVVVTKLLRRAGAGQKIDDGQQTLWGVGMLIVVVNIVGLLAGLAYLMVRGPGG